MELGKGEYQWVGRGKVKLSRRPVPLVIYEALLFGLWLNKKHTMLI